MCDGTRNAIISNAVNVTGVKEIFIEISLDTSFCPLCDESITMEVCLQYSDRLLTDLERKDISKYNDCSSFMTSIPQSVVMPAGNSRLYLALFTPVPLPTGFCVTFQRVTIKYKVCPCKQVGLVIYPEWIISSEANELFIAQCVEYAHNTTSLLVAMSGCTDVAMGGAKCACDFGYEESRGGISCKRKCCSVRESQREFA